MYVSITTKSVVCVMKIISPHRKLQGSQRRELLLSSAGTYRIIIVIIFVGNSVQVVQQVARPLVAHWISYTRYDGTIEIVGGNKMRAARKGQQEGSVWEHVSEKIGASPA